MEREKIRMGTDSIKPIKIKHDINGNPRYVIHFLECCPKHWRKKGENILELYDKVATLMNRIGGRKYNTKKYGGGIVFQSHCITDTVNHINELKRNA